jgi:outer membrane protein OmpA-like peptidoglycan-associated protein
MQFFRTGGAATLLVLLTATTPIAAAEVLSLTYPEGQGTKTDIVGLAPRPGLLGEADVKRKDGRTRVQLRLTQPLPHPQALGAPYTAYVLWAVTPEGRTEKLAELPHDRAFDVEATTSFPSFGLFVTAEPHPGVLEPGPRTIAENALRRDARAGLQTVTARLATDRKTSLPDVRGTDFTTPLLLLGARYAVAMARENTSARHAEAELRDAEIRLAALEQLQLGKQKLSKESESLARDVMRLAEQARTVALDRGARAALADERNAARQALANAQGDAQQARLQAEREEERARAERERAALAQEEAAAVREAQRRAEEETALAQERERQAQSEAERAREAALRAQQETADLQERLFQSLSAVLDTRREARGLIVSLSDVLFDFNRASLKPGAREKLSKLAGILLAYPGSFHIEIEGHTDSVGTHVYNERLSQGRAESVRDYIQQAGIPGERVTRLTGFGETQPVASNDTAAGRQMNRRVEIVITDLDTR